MQQYTVLLDNFEGPLDLLLQLVERNKLDIREVAVSQVTQSYLEHLQHFEIEQEEMGQFLTIASQLLLTKSKRILPNQTADNAGEEPAQDVIARLQTYQQFRERAEALRQKFNSPFISRPEPQLGISAKVRRGINLKPQELQRTWEQLNKLRKAVATVHTVRTKPLSQSEVIACVLTRLTEQSELTLDTLIRNAGSQHEAILCFLAILELGRQNKARIVLVDNETVLIQPGVMV